MVAVLTIPAIALLYFMERYSDDLIERTPAYQKRFDASLVELGALADALSAGAPPAFPVRAGGFDIANGELLPTGAVALYTKEGRDHAGTSVKWGFVRANGVVKDLEHASIIGIPGNTGEYSMLVRFKANWFTICDGYAYLKRGWS